jgi:N,N'-diacetyllegionaminate synthase
MKRKSKIILDDSKHVFVIAEAGSNWKSGSYQNDIKRAKKLIKLAANAGADAVKFQTYNSNSVYVPNAGKSEYLKKSGFDEDIFKVFQEYSMPHKMLKELSVICDKEKILFMSTPFSVDDAIAVNKFVKIHKIAAFEINHVRLLEYLASTKKPIIVSTGASNLSDIDFAVKLLKNKGAKKICLLQTTSKYPASIKSLNLKTISELKKRYQIPIGLSDHSVDPNLAPSIAIGLGATIIEKHFTLNKKFVGPDHNFALNPKELFQFIKTIRESEKALGSGIKKILSEEKELRQFATRSIQAITEISKNDEFVEGKNIDVLRSGNQRKGENARFLTKIIKKKSNRKIKLGDGVFLKDCQ